MTATCIDVGILAYRADDGPTVLQVLTWTIVGGSTGGRTADFFARKLEHNPFEPSLGLAAEADDRIVDFRTFLRCRSAHNGCLLHAVRVVDTPKHSEFHGRGIFIRLTRAALEAASDHDVDMVLNTSISMGLPGYRRMGWSPVGDMPIALRIARPVAFARGLRHRGDTPRPAPLPDIDLPPVATLLDNTAGVQTLLQTAGQSGNRLRTDRDADHVHEWYARVPEQNDRAIVHRVGGRLRGLMSGRPRRRGRLIEVAASEILVPRGDRATARRLLSTTAAFGIDHVATSLSGGLRPTRTAARRAREPAGPADDARRAFERFPCQDADVAGRLGTAPGRPRGVPT